MMDGGGSNSWMAYLPANDTVASPDPQSLSPEPSPVGRALANNGCGRCWVALSWGDHVFLSIMRRSAPARTRLHRPTGVCPGAGGGWAAAARLLSCQPLVLA